MHRLSTVFLLLSARAALSACPSGAGWVETAAGVCHLSLTQTFPPMTADDALVLCGDFEPAATLPEIYSYRDELTLEELSGGADSVWLGLWRFSNDTDFLWPSGDPVTYTNWAAGEPAFGDDECVLMEGADGGWKVASCADSSASVICYLRV
ncbi:macrophage mannose receptor 1-like [Amphibalanus amphitrite]|uniref:macrophage mannose receptor 1-like n=1 Tax=Amphibalanus amphitrite TaxID=1232801 RepID=UPI001C91FF7E|nr:macrophage mannose receptor 1-like [Amphibalanus amphitrite]